MDKEALRALLLTSKEQYVTKHKERLLKIKPLWDKIQAEIPVPERLEPVLTFCTNQELRDIWFYGRLTVSSAPWSGDVGRRFQYLIHDKATGFILGIVGLSSSLSVPLFDKHIGWSKEFKWKQHKINHTMNMSHCVSTPEMSKYLIGKLCALSCRSKEVIDHFEQKYGDKAAVWMTTSLFGKSSIYNRLDGFDYLGNTKGYSATLVPLEVKEKMRKEYQEEHGKHSEIYTKPDGTVVKYGTVKTFQKLSKYANIQRVENLRGVYCIPLADNYKEFLRGETDDLVQFNYPTFEELTTYWKERWLTGRIERLKAGVVS